MNYSYLRSPVVFLLLLFLAGGVGRLAAAETAGAVSLEQGLGLFNRGRYEEALPVLQKTLARCEANGEREGQIKAALGLAATYQALGQFCQAIDLLERMVPVAESVPSREMVMRVKAALGAACAYSRRLKQAEVCLRESLALARELDDSAAQISILQNMGNMLISQRLAPPPEMQRDSLGNLRTLRGEVPHPVFSQEGLELYDAAIALARKSGDQLRLIKILLNKARGYFVRGDFAESEVMGQESWPSLNALPEDRDKAFLLVSWGRLSADLADQLPAEIETLTSQASKAFVEAEKLALQMEDLRTASYASGFMAQLYQKEGRFDEAMVLTQKALFQAQKSGQREAQFEWEWQTARLLRDQGKAEAARAAYRLALQMLQTVRSDLSVSDTMRADGRSFRESSGQVYFELADLLFRQADESASEKEKMACLVEARNTIERFKSTEIEDYFYEDDCVSLLGAKIKPLEAVVHQAAVIYIIPLPDRTELLLTLPGGLRRFKSPVGANELTDQAHKFRVNLQNLNSQRHLEQAQQLWQWLVRPVEDTLRDQKIDTLVFVPDGALRTIPMSALHDGQHYLIERYAVAVSPGLTLMEPKPMNRAKAKLLACGLSTSVQGYPALRAVPKELANIHSAFGGTLLLDKDFLTGNFDRELAGGRYSMVHIASHGEFGSDMNRTFILTFDGRLTMDRLEQILLPSSLSDRPIELLTLSACQTSAGDDRAALGLAGAAIKAGARSTLASLWSIDDDATQKVMTGFYTQLKDHSNLTKAQALQQAQKLMLADPQFKHPAFWSPFMIIGNWL
jgi:CHAT domain-containing protein